MSLTEKMFNRSKPECGIVTDSRLTSNRKFFRDLFVDDWEVLVLRRDENTGRYDWFTLCCEQTEWPSECYA